jgi:uncharacterized membrane protein YqjE
MSEPSGLMESLKRMTGTLLVIFQTRLDLLSSEIEEERLNIEQTLLFASIAFFFFGLAILLLTIFIVVLFWDNYRLPVLAGFIVMYFAAGLLAWMALRNVSGKKSKLFSASHAALSDDRVLLAPPP